MLGRPVTSEAIIGRDEPLRVLDEALGAAAEGRPGIVLIAGEAGVGKTRLAAAAEERARERGALVLHGECMEFGGEEFPYAPVAAALRDVAGDLPPELAGLLPGGGAGEAGFSGDYGQGRLCELLLETLARIAQERAPLVIVVEDVHWADRSSRDLIEFLARNLQAERIALVLTYRTGELERGDPLRRLVAALGRRPIVARLELEPLGRDGVARQLEAIAGRPVPVREVERIHAQSGGNPFFVEELFAAGDADIPATLAEVVSARVGRLSPLAAGTLAIAAAAGGRISHDVLARVASEDGLGTALREGFDAGFLRRDDGDRGIALRHGLIGDVVYRDLVPYERERLHREIGRALADSGAPAAQLAPHWQRAGEREHALAASLLAGDEAMRVYGFSEALTHFERALELARPGEVDRVELLDAAARAARYSGERERSVALAREALAALDHDAEPARAARLYGRLGEYQYWDDAAALECYRRALALLGPSQAPEYAQLLAAEGHALMGLRRLEEARASCEAALEVDPQQPAARTTLGLVLAFLGDPGAGEEQLLWALALPISEHTPRTYVHLGELQRLRGDHAAAAETMRDGEAAAARVGMRSTFGRFMYVNGAADLLRLGRWDEAGARLEVAARVELGLTTAALHHAVAGELHALRGESERARAQLEPALALTREGLPGEFVAPIHGALATLAAVEGDCGEVRRQVAAALAALGEERDPLYTPPLHALGVRAEADAAETARARRDDEALAAAAERADALLDGLARAGDSPDARAHRAAALAERSRLAGEPDPAAWHVTAELWDALGEPHPAAYARFREAEALLSAAGPRDDARDRLAAARATAVALRARPLREEVEALARRARLAIEPTAEPQEDDDELLTRREAEVLRLLADGLTNREIAGQLFISQKTVGTHLGHIFDKLGVHNRVEAADRARRLGVGGRTP